MFSVGVQELELKEFEFGYVQTYGRSIIASSGVLRRVALVRIDVS
jgi:hypothetical protein